MTTIPIEIILQDAEAPVDPTPTPETNIIVPNTGAEIAGNSDVSTSSSVVSITLPAILLVVALVTVCTLLIHKHRKHRDNKLSKKEKLTTVASATIAILAATVLVGNLVIPATNATTSVEPGTAELETEDKITIIATREQDSDEPIIATVKNTSYATANLDFGYKVTASMAEGLDSANLYLDGDEASEYYIAPVENARLGDNTWGYRLSEEDEDCLPVPIADTPATIVKGNDNTIEGKPIDIYYTIKVDKSLPAGTYTGEIEYTLTDNNFPSTLTTMQGMTTEICENTFTPGNSVTDPVPTATLEDIRDHKTYTIAKLADGKCWMTQNLDLDLSTSVTLTPEDTDVLEDWTPERKTIETDDLAYGVWMNDAFRPYSYDPGNIYYYTSGSDAGDIQYNSLAECETAEHMDCSHYHAGNYYNWSAAVASNDTSGITERYSRAPNSICPKGWRLPMGNSSEDAFYEEMASLVELYGKIEFQSDTQKYNYLQGGFNAIRTAPFWLNMPGQVVYGNISESGTAGAYLAGSIAGERPIIVSQFDFSKNLVRTVDVSVRDYGRPVRCVAK